MKLDLPMLASQTTPNPWLVNFGRFQDDPTFDDLLDEIKNYRQLLDTASEVE